MIEILEPRIAPASLTGKVLTYTDVDGDEVKIAFKMKGELHESMFTFDSAFDTEGPQQLREIDLTGSGLGKVSMTMVVTQNGDGLADVGSLNAAGTDLGKVIIDGDLGRIVAGDANTKNGAIKVLALDSLGTRGLETQAPGGSLASVLTGGAKQIVVFGDVMDASLSILGGTQAEHGKVESLTIDGSLRGGMENGSGHLLISGSVSKLSIGEHVVGGSGADSGMIDIAGNVKMMRIGGSIFGSAGSQSGFVDIGTGLGVFYIGGDIVGGSGPDDCGRLFIESGGIKTGVVDGSVIGGTGGVSNGGICAIGAIKALTVRGDLLGNLGDGSGTLEAARFGTLVVKGQIGGGAGANAGSIQSYGDIKTLVIGEVVGEAGARATISAGGGVALGKTKDLAIGTLVIRGDVAGLDILAGYERVGETANRVEGVNGNAQIGSVTVLGGWSASSIVAGVRDTAGDGFGNGDDGLIPAEADRVLASIGRVTFKGEVQGSETLLDSYGITAQWVKKVSVDGVRAALTAGPNGDTLLVPGSVTPNFQIREVSGLV